MVSETLHNILGKEHNRRRFIATLGTGLATSALVSATMSAADAATEWISLPAGPAPANNPLIGFVPYAGNYGNMPYSMEWFYLPVSALVKGPGTYDWTSLESQLNAIAGRGRQSVFRFYLDYPGKASGIPSYLLSSGLSTNSYDDFGNNGVSVSPNYEDTRLLQMLEEFISAFGTRYDGDPRIGFIQMGLLGFWGEWHTYPHENWFASATSQQRVLQAYVKSFLKTKLQVRYPDAANSKLNIGYHDDSFGTQTLAGPGWHFMDRMNQAGTTEKWLTQPIGGELRPEIQNCAFESPMVCPANGTDINDYPGSVKATHASWLLNHGAFEPGYLGQELTNAKIAAQSLGYRFQATHYAITPGATGQVTLSVAVRNVGIAPFYYDWPVKIAAVDSTGKFIRQWGPSWSLSALKPGMSTQWRALISTAGMPAGNYTLLIRPLNPMANGVPLRFANASQDATKAGWLTLGKKYFSG